MFPCLSEVHRNLSSIVNRLFEEVDNLRIAVVAHGDYCDEKNYLMRQLDFTTDKNAIHQFISDAGRTYGGDYPEAYEYVLHKVQDLS